MAPKSFLLLLAPALLTLLALPCSLGVSNIVTDWSFALRRGNIAYNVRHQISLRYYTLLHSSQYQVLNAKRRARYAFNESILVSTISHFVLSTIFPDQQTLVYDALLASHVGNANITREYAFARTQATVILRNRIGDGSSLWANFIPAPNGSAAGQYQFTPNQTFAFYPQLGDTTPFFVRWSSIPANYTPPDPNSAEFATEATEVLQYGGRTAAAIYANDSTKNTSDFWAEGFGPGNIWNSVAIGLLPNSTSVYNTARFLTYLNSAAYDAAIVTWKLKYTRLFWRPITAIRQGSTSFTADPDWLPYLSTPAHPEYPSGHSTTAGAFGHGLKAILKTDSVTFTVDTGARSRGNLLDPRTYTSIQDAINENSLSRILGGIHFRTAVRHGEAIGAATALTARTPFGIK